MNRPQNIKTFGGPLRSTRRKLSRPDRFAGIKGAGGGDKTTNKTPINHIWSQSVERLNNGSINVGWWNHEMFLDTHPLFTLTGPTTMNVDKSHLRGPADNPWVSGPKTSGLSGVNTLGDRRHVANTRDSDEYRENSITGGDLWIDENRPSNRKYHEDRLNRIHKTKVAECWERMVKESNSRGDITERRTTATWNRLHTMGRSGLGTAKKKVSS